MATITAAEAIDISLLVLKVVGEVQQLITKAIEAHREGDEAKALAYLDDAIAKYEAGSPAAKAQLDQVKQRMADYINQKFDKSDAGTSEEPK